jgi:hypothetical protein
MLFAYSFSPVYLFFPFLLIFILGFEIAMFIDAWTNNGIARGGAHLVVGWHDSFAAIRRHCLFLY